MIENEVQETLEPTYFENNGLKYVYDYNKICIEQAELAKEAAEFKANMNKAHPDRFEDVLKSKGAEWFTIILRYLLLEVDKDVVIPFSYDKAHSVTDKFVKTLPIKERERLVKVVAHFFDSIGLIGELSPMNTEPPKEDLTPMLLEILLRKSMMPNNEQS